jgi:hypothetical protein
MRPGGAPLLSCVTPRCTAGCVMTGTSGPPGFAQPPRPNFMRASPARGWDTAKVGRQPGDFKGLPVYCWCYMKMSWVTAP